MHNFIVMEHSIQASDFSHDMQRWHDHKDWTKQLFVEMYKAFRTDGRAAATGPSFGWYNGEIGIFGFDALFRVILGFPPYITTGTT